MKPSLTDSVTGVQTAPSPWALSSRPTARWAFRECDPLHAKRVATECGLSPLIAGIIAARGMTCPNQIQAFLDSPLSGVNDPFLLKGMQSAVDRILRAIKDGESIWIYGDYDVDGVTATAILKCAFDFLNVPVNTYIPHRLSEGYGLRAETIKLLADRGARLIITVDNGITAVQEIGTAAGLGVDVIITDHHQPGHTLPPAYAIVNPKQEGCEYPFKDLCGAGVAFKTAHALLKQAVPESGGAKDFLKSLLDFVALGTVADVVTLLGENRCFVVHGIKLLRNGGRPGFRSLFEVMGVQQSDVEAGNLAYTVAPRLNAAGRTEHAELALELLLATNPARAKELALRLDQLNNDRRLIEGDITEEALGLIDEASDEPIIVIERKGWHLGVVGIVASRILERYYRPVIVLGVDGEWAKGSARSIHGFDIHAALGACSEHLVQYGGHTMAAGLRLKAADIPSFRNSINEYARGIMRDGDLTPVITIDASVCHADLTLENVQALEALGPFGAGNPKPVLCVEGLTLIEEPRVIKDRHLKLHLSASGGRPIQAIGFSMGHRAAELKLGVRGLRLAGTPGINRWGGQNRVEIEIKDFQTACR